MEKFKKILLEGGDAGGRKDINDTEFENLLKSVKLLVDNLHQEVEKEHDSKGGVLRRVVDLKADLKMVDEAIEGLKDEIDDSGRQLEEAKKADEKTKEILDRVDDLLREIDDLIDVEGRKSKEAAEEAQKKYEKEANELKDMADRAARLAEKQTKKAGDISFYKITVFLGSLDCSDICRWFGG